MQTNRLADGGRIDRSRTLVFTFNGRRFEGYAGDTLAAALLANGVRVIGRSFKYHRPRGVIGSGAEEPNAVLQIGNGASTEPNLRATQVELYDELQAQTSKGWPSLRYDLGVASDFLSKLFGAGFYYKTFMYPARLWPLFEYSIRSAAGLGAAPSAPDPDTYSHRNAHCDVLVAGAGPAGLMAARAAALAGARVIIADEQHEFGGSLLASTAVIDAMPAPQWADVLRAELDSMDNVICLPRSTVFGHYDHNFLAILERCTNHLGERIPARTRQRLWRVRARHVISAQGAFERPLVFQNNDRPGTMLASAVSVYINRYAVRPGRRAVVFTNNDSAYQTALDLNRAGAHVLGVVDSRPEGGGDLADAVKAAGIRVLDGSVVTGVRGRRRVRAVEIARLSGGPNALAGSERESLQCDLLAMSGGYSPAVHLHSQAGGRNVWDDDRHCFVPGGAQRWTSSVGSCNGTWDLTRCMEEGVAAGAAAAASAGYAPVECEIPSTASVTVAPGAALWRVCEALEPERMAKQFVDYQNDTTVSDIRLAVREGYTNVEHLKRYTALGFGTDQGKLGNINGMAILAECLNKPIAETGTTTFRPAYTPVSLGALAGADVGELYDPVRKTALHAWHEDRAAPFETVGQWLRPWYFPNGDEDIDAAVRRECLAVRQAVGIMDASTLGKIDVRGPDAVRFLDRIYTHSIADMKIGRCAYGILLGEDGMLKDDGVMARLGEQHFYLTTTTGGAAEVLGWLELWLQTEWPELEVYLTSLTDRYSTVAVAGPDARNVLSRLDCDIDLSAEAFGFMAMHEGQLAGVPVQLFRVSFSGELAFEVNVESHYALHVWESLMDAGQEYGITPYGTETMHVLRAEKGFVIVGQDTDGSVTPVDLGMRWLLAKDKDFLGKRSLQRRDCLRTDRKQFVGLLSTDGASVVPEGAQLVVSTAGVPPLPIDGHVTSSYASPVLGHPIALGLIRSGHSRTGETALAVDSGGREFPVTIVSPVFYDPRGERQRV